jgi:3-deoxy-D-manno-octulosonic-acid transferase
MQSDQDAKRLASLGTPGERIHLTGNLKFDQEISPSGSELTEYFRTRFAISPDKPLILAASTHEPEDRYVIGALESELGHSCRLMIAPRHPERFEDVAAILRATSYSVSRRSESKAHDDRLADVILLDSIGELRAVYPLAEIVFVGGSLIPHGGQSVFEPAVEGRAIVTGPYTSNFQAVVTGLIEEKAIRQTRLAPDESQISERLYEEFIELLENKQLRSDLGTRAANVMKANRGATSKTIDHLMAAFLLRNN